MAFKENESCRKFRRIVLVDDNRASNFLHESLLQELSITDEIVILQNGQQALDYLTTQWQTNTNQEESAQDLILIDVHMPVMDGWELLTELETTHQSCLQQNTVIMLTTCTQESDIDKAKKLTIKGVLEKPLDEQKVSAILESIL